MKSAKKSSKKTKITKVTKAAKSSPNKSKKVAAPKRLTKKKSGKSRVGIFGGNFDPIHNGHLNSLETVAKELRLNKIRVVPTFQSPLRVQLQGSNAEHRLKMAELAVGQSKMLQLDPREIKRGGVSYTIDTINELQKYAPNELLFLIIGMDQFENFEKWKDVNEILHKADLIVTSRPGFELPDSLERFPEGMKPYVQRYNRKMTMLRSGRNIHFVQLNDLEVSASDIRKNIRERFSIDEYVPAPVAAYIHEHKLYENISRKIGDFEKFTQQCADLLTSKGGINVQAFDHRPVDGATEFTLIASGTSTRHTSALADFLSREVKSQMGVWPQGMEGSSEGRWVVLDYGSLMVHVFYDFLRQEYRLEELWSKSRALPLKLESPTL